MSVLEITDLTVTYGTDDGRIHAANDVSFSIDDGINYGLAGESGSGKSTVAEAVLGLLPENGTVESGEIRFDDRNLLALLPSERRDILWEEIAYIPQSAMDALDPVMTTGAQIRQAIQTHRNVSTANARDRVRELFDTVGHDPGRIDEYPHEFSGGMRQRVTIAMALALEPDLIIADEPTTGLDVIVQDKIIDKILEIQNRIDSSLLLITHEVGVLAETCDDVSILYGGSVMEQGSVDNVLINPTHPYTMGLRNSFPEIDADEDEAVSIPGSPPNLEAEPTGCLFRDRCPFAEEECANAVPDSFELPNRNHRSACHFVERAAQMRRAAAQPETWGHDERETRSGEGDRIDPDPTAATERPPDAESGSAPSKGADPDSEEGNEVILSTHGLSKWYELGQPLLDRLRGAEPEYVRAVDDVSLSVRRSEILGIAGESGCGKSTLGETIALLEDSTDGEIVFAGRSVSDYWEDNLTEFRSKAQIVFQDPFDSLNPRQTVRQLVGEPLAIHDRASDDREAKVRDTLDRVGLTSPETLLDQYPHELSGGQRQRVAIARALVLDPDFLVCDEPASMLDVSLKVNLLTLLRELADEEEIGVVYISHDLASLSQISDRLAIMYLGRIVESGPTDRIVSSPDHPYTSLLLSAAPDKDPSADRDRVALQGEPSDPIDLPTGCVFEPRCPRAEEDCRRIDPHEEPAENGERMVECHFPLEEGDRMELPETDEQGKAEASGD